MTPQKRVEQPRDKIPAYQRGYRSITVQNDEVRDSIKDEAKTNGFATVSDYLDWLNKTANQVARRLGHPHARAWLEAEEKRTRQ